MNSTNLLEHQINKFGVVTVMDILLLDPATEEPVLFLDTLKITSLEQEGEQKEIRGGIGAPELISYDFARTITLEIQDALASMGSLKTLWGGRFLEDEFDYTGIFEAKVREGGLIDLPKGMVLQDEPDLTKALILDAGNEKTYTVADADGVPADDDEETKTVLTLGKYPKDDTPEEKATPSGEAKKGSIVKVFIPAVATVGKDHDGVKGEAMAMAINSIDVPPTVKMVGQTFFIDQATGKQIPMQMEIPLLKINIAGGLTMEAEGDAAVFDFEAKALADPITKDIFILKRL